MSGHLTTGPVVPDLTHLVEGRRGIGEVIAWLKENGHGLPVPYWSSQEAWGEVPGGYRLRLQLMCHGAESFAEAARRLAKGAAKGAVRKHHDDGYLRVTRRFGPVEVEAWVQRDQSCTARVIGTETSIETAVRCVHCGAPIQMAGGVWWHVAADAGRYTVCQGSTTEDDDGLPIGGTPATPPDFTAATTTTRDVIEWDCGPLLAGDGEVVDPEPTEQEKRLSTPDPDGEW